MRRIAALIVDVDSAGGKKGKFEFDTSYVEPMEMQVGAGTNKATMYVLMAAILTLVLVYARLLGTERLTG